VVNKADAIAVVNGHYIAKATLDKLEKEIAERSHGQAFPKEKLIEELIQRELLVQDAEQKHLETSAEIVAQLDSAKKTLLTQADVQDFIKANPVTDAEIKAEYDSKVAGENGIEYKARHILVKTEEEAKKIIAELDKGGDFAKLANKHSLDGKEAQNGGDLGWFAPSQMVAPFSEAVVKLEKGQYTKAPVKTQFGWHIILREDSKAQTPPPLEAVKEQLMPFLQREKVKVMIENLRKQAKVEILVPLTDEAKPAAIAENPVAENPVAEKPAAEKPAAEKPVAEKPVAEQVQVEEVKDKDGQAYVEEVKDKDGQAYAEDVVIKKELIEDKPTTEKTADTKAAPATATPEVKK
jgi:peptidyl-prolyl cis-trans isomerase C